ncbi:MAG: AEC family transporter [Deltaproteobacteria bacterium]|nr:AEC family transporter [Deltaproteobacteria bacterium]
MSMVFVDILLPIFLIIGLGVLFEKLKHPDFKSISNLTLYFFTPCLIFAGLLKGHSQMSVFLPKAILFMLLLTLSFWGVSLLAGRLLKLDAGRQSAFSLTTIMMNSGNYGLPLVLFAYGPEGLAYGVIVLVLFTLPLGTLAVYIASRGRDHPAKALLEMFRVPLFHAIILATVWRCFSLPLPGIIFKAVDMVGQAAIPGLLMLLGMQLARTRIKGDLPAIGVSSLLRLVLSPLLAILFCAVLGIHGLPRNVLILQTSTPAAIIPLLYAVNYDTHPEMVAGTILVSTLLSALSLTVLLYFLGV